VGLNTSKKVWCDRTHLELALFPSESSKSKGGRVSYLYGDCSTFSKVEVWLAHVTPPTPEGVAVAAFLSRQRERLVSRPKKCGGKTYPWPNIIVIDAIPIRVFRVER